MTLQTSGPISMLDIYQEYGGNAPQRISNYYRGGSLVPSTVVETVTVRTPSSGWYYPTLYRTTDFYYYQVSEQTSGTYAGLNAWTWNSTVIGYYSTSLTSITSGGYTYYKGPEDPESKHVAYSIARSYTTQQNVSANVNVPFSGRVSLSNYYGGERSNGTTGGGGYPRLP